MCFVYIHVQRLQPEQRYLARVFRVCTATQPDQRYLARCAAPGSYSPKTKHEGSTLRQWDGFDGEYGLQ